MTSDILDYKIFESAVKTDARTYTATIDFRLLQCFKDNFGANASSFWFRFFGEVDFRANRFDTLTDVTLHLVLGDDAKADLELAASVLTRLSKRAAWGEHSAMLSSANVDAIYITCENLKPDDTPRIPSADEAERLAMIRNAFADMLDANDADDEQRSDLATKIVMDLLIGEFDTDARGAMATVVGVWLGDRVAELTGFKWHCIDADNSVTFCIHNPKQKISCFPFDAMNKRLNSHEAFRPHLLAATFADALKS